MKDALLLDRQVCFPLYAASNMLNRLYKPVLKKLGLTYPQYLVMLVLWELQPQSVGKLGDRLFLDSGTLTPLLKRMETAGLIKRIRDANDERRVLVHLTPKGIVLKQQAAAVPTTLAAGLHLPLDDIESLRTQVQSLVSLLSSKLNT
jgi:MarR family transcriptional regulator, organic hydroperoxide resistance regulator